MPQTGSVTIAMGRMVAQTGDRACLLQWAYDAGITGGCTPTKFCPKGDVTRAEMASFLVRMFQGPRPADRIPPFHRSAP
jgi:hypothetical protein